MDVKEMWNKAYRLHQHADSMAELNDAIILYHEIIKSFPRSEEAKDADMQLSYAIVEKKRYENGTLSFSNTSNSSANTHTVINNCIDTSSVTFGWLALLVIIILADIFITIAMFALNPIFGIVSLIVNLRLAKILEKKLRSINL